MACLKNNVNTTIIAINGDKIMPGFGDRSFETLNKSIVDQFGSMAAFNEKYPNISIQSASNDGLLLNHGGGGNSPSVQEGMCQGWKP